MVISAVKATQSVAGSPTTACKACEAQCNPLPTTVSDPLLTPKAAQGPSNLLPILDSFCSWRLLLHDFQVSGSRVWGRRGPLLLPGHYFCWGHVHPGHHRNPAGKKGWAPWTVAHQVPLSVGFPRQRILEGVVISSSRGSSRPWDRTGISCATCIAGGFFTPEPLGSPLK